MRRAVQRSATARQRKINVGSEALSAGVATTRRSSWVSEYSVFRTVEASQTQRVDILGREYDVQALNELFSVRGLAPMLVPDSSILRVLRLLDASPSLT